MERIFQALMFVDFYGMAPWTYNIQQPPAFSLQPQIIESTKLRDVAVFVTCSTIWKLLDKDDDLGASHMLLNTKGTSRFHNCQNDDQGIKNICFRFCFPLIFSKAKL